MPIPTLDPKSMAANAIPSLQNQAKPAIQYQTEYHIHIFAFSALYAFTSVMVLGSTSEPAQNHIGLFSLMA